MKVSKLPIYITVILGIIALAIILFVCMGCASTVQHSRSFNGVTPRPLQGGLLIVGQECDDSGCHEYAVVCIEEAGAMLCVPVDPLMILPIDEVEQAAALEALP